MIVEANEARAAPAGFPATIAAGVTPVPIPTWNRGSESRAAFLRAMASLPMGTALRIRLQFKRSFLMMESNPARFEHVNSFTRGMPHHEHASGCRNAPLEAQPGREGPGLAVGGARSGLMHSPESRPMSRSVGANPASCVHASRSGCWFRPGDSGPVKPSCWSAIPP